MPPAIRWSLELPPLPNRPRRRRWLAAEGGFTTDPAKALRVAHPEAAVARLQSYAAARGWKAQAIEKLRMVPAPRDEAA
ncbi:MAG: hypothetical protein VKM01_02360 [Cyanobacteriota bacterium]|jgi:hypothetical protein|nr:hypothetical protein [Cyanobacteriota bacterium]